MGVVIRINTYRLARTNHKMGVVTIVLVQVVPYKLFLRRPSIKMRHETSKVILKLQMELHHV